MADFTALREAIPGGQVITPNDRGYEESLRRWSTACEKPAAVVVRPSNTAEVTSAIIYATDNRLPLTVLCGGHSTSGASSITDGMVIDLSLLRSISINKYQPAPPSPTAAAGTVTFGGGCLWKHIDAALLTQGLATVAGVVNHTGVGGLILGGGHGYLTPKHGLTIDVMLAAEVVLADGSIVIAAEAGTSKERLEEWGLDSEEGVDVDGDLFWAMKGAGAHFGVVTRFVLRVFEQDLVWSGTVTYTPEELPRLIHAANEFHYNPESHEKGHCLSIGIGFSDSGERVLIALPMYHGDEEAGRNFFKDLFEQRDSTETQGDMRMMSTAQVNELLNPVFEHGKRRLMGSANAVMPLDPASVQAIADKFWTFCEKTNNAPQIQSNEMTKSVIAIEFFPTDKITQIPLTASAYANRGTYYDVVTSFGWTSSSIDSEVRQFNRELCEEVRRMVGYVRKGDGEGPVGRYVNIEADRVRAEDAYGGSLGRLRALKGRYDPGNVFRKGFGVEPEVEKGDA